MSGACASLLARTSRIGFDLTSSVQKLRRSILWSQCPAARHHSMSCFTCTGTWTVLRGWPRSVRVRIPVVTDGAQALVTDYARSSLARFHRAFHATQPHLPSAWANTYDRFDLSRLPPCVGAGLAVPNDRLLKPEYLQHVTRFLMSEGWLCRTT